MKKVLFAFLVLISCFLASSFSIVLLSPFVGAAEVDKAPDKYTQRLYSLIEETQSYTAMQGSEENDVINKLANVMASHMIIDYDIAAYNISKGEDTIEVEALFIDPAKIKLDNDIEFDFSKYNDYIWNLQDHAMRQIQMLAEDETIYTKEYTIKVSFKPTYSDMVQEAVLDEDSMAAIYDECYVQAERIYKDYISTSDISTAFFCKSIKELRLDNIVEIYNESHPDGQITEEWEQSLFVKYSKHYLGSLVIQNIIKTNTGAEVSGATINYNIEEGSATINTICQSLLSAYYAQKQPPVDKNHVIDDFGTELLAYRYTTEAYMTTKIFDFTYSQNLNTFTLNNDFYVELLDDIYEEFSHFNEIFSLYYPGIIEQYFFIERPYKETTVITDKTGDTNYRQIDIKVTGGNDCYVKLYSYNIATDSVEEPVFVAYIKAGETLQVYVPEGDYMLKYATGTMWYGDIFMFSDEGQYFSSPNVISVHEFMMTTIIEIGDLESGSIPAYPQTPGTF